MILLRAAFLIRKRHISQEDENDRKVRTEKPQGHPVPDVV